MNQHQFDTFLIKTEELFDSLVKYESQLDSGLLFFDLETNSEIEKIAKVYGIGICFTDTKAFYIPWRNKDGTDFWPSGCAARIITWLNGALSRHGTVGHNIVYDTLVYENNFNFVLDPYIHSDTILMKHTLEEEPPFALKEIAPIILGPWADKAQERLKENVLLNGGKWTKDHKDMYLADTDILGEYCCWDVMLTLLLFNHFEAQLKVEELHDFFYKEEVMPLYKEVTISMKRRGFKIDLDYFEDLKTKLTKEISSLEDSILTEISPMVNAFEQNLLDKKYPVKPTGNYPKAVADLYQIPLPLDKKKGTITLAAKSIKAQLEVTNDIKFKEFYEWLLNKNDINNTSWLFHKKTEVQRELFFRDHEDKKYIFNLDSGDHLGYLFFTCMGVKPTKFTDGGKPSTDKEVVEELIETYKDREPWITKLSDYKKLSKLQSTYVEGIVDRQIDGIIYTSMLQFGTTSGRYSSRNPNLQNQPRVKDEDSGLSELVLTYVNAIKRGFISGPGYKVVNADYASLEPRCFAHMSGDEKLRDVFRKGEDLYSRVGIDTFKLQGYSAFKKDPNFLGTLSNELRQKSKEFVLMIPYGAEEAQVSRKMGVDFKEAGTIIRNYLNSFPNLRKYMNRCNYSAKTNGYVKTELGRVRHLKECKSIHALYTDQILDYKWANRNGKKDVRGTYRNLLNNAKNFPIQGLAAHIVNRAMITTAKRFKEEGIDAWVALQVHDEITCIAKEEHADKAAKILQECMEKTTIISIPLVAEPMIADNWADSK